MSSILVVIAEVVARNQIDSGFLLQLPMLGAQLLGGGAHVVERCDTLPISFDNLLQLAVLADARETGDGSENGHESSI